GHTVLLGSHYLGDLQLSSDNKLRVILVLSLFALVLLGRSSFFWRIIGQKKFYVPPKKLN
ncbi:MAG: sulfite exporter TauE/SafE family protein, partial [Waterburya sp.]